MRFHLINPFKSLSRHIISPVSTRASNTQRWFWTFQWQSKLCHLIFLRAGVFWGINAHRGVRGDGGDFSRIFRYPLPWIFNRCASMLVLPYLYKPNLTLPNTVSTFYFSERNLLLLQFSSSVGPIQCRQLEKYGSSHKKFSTAFQWVSQKSNIWVYVLLTLFQECSNLFKVRSLVQLSNQ